MSIRTDVIEAAEDMLDKAQDEYDAKRISMAQMERAKDQYRRLIAHAETLGEAND